jgi:hypothetical protein
VRAGKFSDPADMMRTSPATPDLAASFVRGTNTCLPDLSHFIPMESPERTAKLILDTLALL